MTRSLPPSSSSSAAQRRFVERRPDGPRRVKAGLKLSTKDGPSARSTLAMDWLNAVGARLSEEQLQLGLEYARAGQIVSLQVLAGELDAKVQGTAPRPYATRIRVTALSESQWRELIDAMAGEAIYGAKLLSGELPPDIEQLFEVHGASLVAASHDLSMKCSCDDASGGGACKHIAAVAHMFADALSEEPLQIFTLLGLPSDQLMERLRQARMLHAHGVASAHADITRTNDQHAPPLDQVIEDFWRGGWTNDLEQQAIAVPAPQVRHALLRRLGPSPISGRFPMVGLLASIYDEVSAAAQRLSDAPASSATDTDADSNDEQSNATFLDESA